MLFISSLFFEINIDADFVFMILGLLIGTPRS
jgi:hypothetical protein